MATVELDQRILEILAELQALNEQRPVSPGLLAERAGVADSTLRRALTRLVQQGRVSRVGGGRSTRYALTRPLIGFAAPLMAAEPTTIYASATTSLVPWSQAASQARDRLRAPLGAREPVTYELALVDAYVPNSSAFLPRTLADELHLMGKTKDQQPAGTYARNVLEQLLIDLSWSSSRLEGNKLSRLDTEALFKSGASGCDRDAIMLLNHKQAIEFMVDTVPLHGLKMEVIHNLHAVLMQDLLADDMALGAIRRKVVRISDTVYVPTQVPQLLHEMLEQILQKAALVNNPLEAAFFLWVNLAYLQPFEDGNKRVSRLAANIPLMIFNCAPLSFLDVDQNDYADAMLGVYEMRDMAPAADLFAWTYRRSCAKYAAVTQSMGAPDPHRVKFRSQLTEAIGLVVRHRLAVSDALAAIELTDADKQLLEPLLRRELANLQEYNCARYRLATSTVQGWIAAGRPA